MHSGVSSLHITAPGPFLHGNPPQAVQQFAGDRLQRLTGGVQTKRLDAVQDLIDRKVAQFLVTGSSARKLRRYAPANLLPGIIRVLDAADREQDLGDYV